MIYRRLSPINDYQFGRGLQDFCQDADAVGQAVKTRLLLLKGEWWENIEDGLPLFQNILGSRTKDIDGVDLIIRERIVGTQGVTNINFYQSDLDNITRIFKINCEIETIYGNTEVEVLLS